MKYCWIKGLSRPYFASAAATASGFSIWRWLSTLDNGFAGTTWLMRNATVTIPSSTIGIRRIRPTM